MDGRDGRRWKYVSALNRAGHEAVVTRELPKSSSMKFTSFDVLHIHAAPDGFALRWLEFLNQIHPNRRPGIVLDIDDDMGLLAGELDPVRQHEVVVCNEQLMRYSERVITVVASPAWATKWDAHPIRNFPMKGMLPRPTIECLRPDVGEESDGVSVYAGSVTTAPGHHRNPATWDRHPDVIFHKVPPYWLIDLLSRFDVGLIPFPVTPFTSSFEPHKLFEYLRADLSIHADPALHQVARARAEFAGKEIPDFETQLPLLEQIYADAIERRSRVDLSV